jgi:methyl-accepting chemotaxis protein
MEIGEKRLMKHLTSIPIFRRLFLAFFLAALILNGSILGMSSLYIGALQSHGMTSNETRPFIFWTILAMVGATAGVIVLGYIMNLTITQPLADLAALARRVREGKTDARASVRGCDEIAVVASSINHMLDHIGQLVRQTQAQRDQLQQEAERLINQVSKISEGDLTIQAEVDSASMGVLADFFNYIVEELSSLVVRVKYVAMEVGRSTYATQQEMFQLVTAADQQLASIGETTTIVEGMAQACLQVVERTKHLDTVNREARQATQQGRLTIQQIVQGVEHINRQTQEIALAIRVLAERSQEIDEVIRVLDGFVYQSNRLSLDAAVQVAMIKDPAVNQGFGEIAAEIRRVSEQSKVNLTTVSKNMRQMRLDMENVAKAMQEAAGETVAGTRRIRETEFFFSTIFNLVEQQAGEGETITGMMEKIFEASWLISQTMQEVSQSTQQTSQRTRTVAQEMQQLASQAQQLRASVEVFKLKS